MHQRPFKQIDVFSTRPGDGNALAVVIEACDLTDTAMQRFAAPMGNNEDPATGSLNASLAQWLIAEGLAPTHYLVSQGESLGRAARIRIAQDSHAQVWVGGHAVTCIEGSVLV